MSELILEKVLGEKHMIEILIYLKAFGPRSKTEIYKSISTSPHMSKKLETLEQSGLVSTYCVEGSKRIMNRLTPTGMTMAEGLGNMESLMGGNVDDYKSDKMDNGLFRMEHREKL